MTAGPSGPAPLPRRIVLTGFMGAGKSTIGGLLASRLGWRFVDVDTLITQQQGQPVAAIFAQQGEPFFRQLEAEAVAAVLASSNDAQAGSNDTHEPAVIALGGGAVETAAVRDLLFTATPVPGGASAMHVLATVTIFLDAPLSELLARCQNADETPVRPLLSPSAEPPSQRLRRRLPHYRRAHFTVSTSATSPENVVDSILTWLDGPWPDKL